MVADVAVELMELGGGDPFIDVRRASEEHRDLHVTWVTTPPIAFATLGSRTR